MAATCNNLIPNQTSILHSNATRIINDALNNYYNSQKFSEPHCVSFDENYSLPYELLYLCMKYKIPDSQLVAEVLQLTWDILYDFSSLFERQWLRHKLVSYNRLRWDVQFLFDFDDSDVQIFFLNHATEVRFTIHGNRLADILYGLSTSAIQRAVVSCDVTTLQILLRYGCKLDLSNTRLFEVPNIKDCSSATDCFTRVKQRDVAREVGNMIFTLRSKVATKQEVHHDSMSTNIFPNLSLTTDNICDTLNMLLRGITAIDRTILCFSRPLITNALILIDYLLEPDELLDDNSMDLDFIKALVEQNYIPNLGQRSLYPATLEHLSRCKIREILNENWQLPHGLYKLPLPQLMKRYLDLDFD